jgi:hypothetical protein
MKAPLSRPREGQAAMPGSAAADHAEARDAPPSSPLPWYLRPVSLGLVAFLLYAAIWHVTIGKNMLHDIHAAHLDQYSMDPNFYTWSLSWWPYAVGHGLNPFFSHLIWAPRGHSLAWVTAIPPIALLAAPLTLAAGPIVAFNVLAAFALPLSAWAAFVLCRRLTQKFWPALVGGAVFGFSAYEINHVSAGQLNLTYSLLLPLLAYQVVLWRDKAISTRVFVGLAGITMAVQFYLFLETFADLTAVLAAAVVVGILVAGRAHRAEVIRLAKCLGAAYGVAFLLALPYLAYALSTKVPRLQADTSLDLLSLVVPRPEATCGWQAPLSVSQCNASTSFLHHLALGPTQTSYAGYVGIPLLVVAVLLAVTGWSRRLVRFLACMLAFIIVASLGPDLYFEGGHVITFPWAFLWNLPIVRNAYPSRLMLFAFLTLAVMAALWLAGTASKYWRVPLALLVVFALYQDAPVVNVAKHSTVPAFIATGTYRHVLSRGETVVVVSNIGNAGMLWQADTDFYMRLAGGYINQSITRRSDLPPQVQHLAHASPAYVLTFESFVRKDKIGAILLDRQHPPKWVGIFRRMGLVGHTSGNVVVYPANDCRSCRPLDRSQISHGRSHAKQSPATAQST